MATTPTDLVNDYINSRISVPKTPYTQEQSERYSAEADNSNNDEYLRKKREYEEEPVPTREEYEANQREAEAEIEYNSRQKELDDLEESEPDYDEDNHLEDAEFTGNYFAKPDENEEKSSRLGDRIRARYDSLRASASDTAENLASSFGESFGAAAGAASAKYSRFKRGDPIFSVQSPVRRGKNPYTRSISRAGRSISRPYVGGRFDNFTLGTNGNTNPYYPVNEGRQSVNNAQTMDMYLPNGEGLYEGEFLGRKAFKQSEFSDERERYDPFGFGSLSGDGYDVSHFGDSLLGGVGNTKESSIFGGMSAGTDTVLGNGAMFNAPRGKAKKEVSGFGLDMIIGDSGGMYNTSDPLPRKPTNKRKSASRKTAKKATKRKASTRKQTYTGFALP